MAALQAAKRGPTYNPVDVNAYRKSGGLERRMRPTSEPMMTLAIHDQRLAKPGPQNAALRDYDSVRRAIAFISRALAHAADHRGDGGCRRRHAG